MTSNSHTDAGTLMSRYQLIRRLELLRNIMSYMLRFIILSFILTISSASFSQDTISLSVYPKTQGTLRIVSKDDTNGLIIGRVLKVVASTKPSNTVSLYPADTKPKSPGIYTDIPAKSPVWQTIGSNKAVWKLSKSDVGWEKQHSIITLASNVPIPTGWQQIAETESVNASARSTSSTKPPAKSVNGWLSVVLRGLDRLVQSKGNDVFVQLCVDGRARAISNNLTSPISWDTKELPDGCYVVELRVYTNGANFLLFISPQVLCIRNDL